MTRRPDFFSPGIYEHAAALIGESPCKVSRDPTLLFKAHKTAWETYNHPMVVAGIDVYNVEAEILGAEINMPQGDEVPSIVAHPFTTVAEIPQARPPDPDKDGRMPIILDVAARLCRACHGTTVYVPVCGPLALANGLVGFDEMLCSVIDSPDEARDALMHLAQLQAPYVRAIHAAGALPLIFESGASPPLLPPSLFPEIEAPALAALFTLCREACGCAPACILGGDVAPILGDLLALKPGFLICPSETQQRSFVDMAATQPEVAIRINMPVATLAQGNWSAITASADAAMVLAGRLNNASIGTGVLPYNTKPHQLLALRDYVLNSTHWNAPSKSP